MTTDSPYCASLRLPVSLLAILAWGCSPSESPQSLATRPPTVPFSEFAATTPIDPNSGLYVVEGDMLMTSAQFRAHYEAQAARSGALIVHTSQGSDNRWDDVAKLDLSYCVSPAFKTATDNPTYPTYYDYIVERTGMAASTWNSAANIRIWHNAAEDANCDSTSKPPQVTFRVVRSTQTSSFVGPLSKPATQPGIVNLTPTAPLAVIKHEFGHMLGFLHEHIRYPGTSCAETITYRDVNYPAQYDTASIMHYDWCEGYTGTPGWPDNRDLSELDRRGAATLYGCPAACASGQTCESGVCRWSSSTDFLIQNVDSNHCADSGGLVPEGSVVVQWPCTNETDMKWRVHFVRTDEQLRDEYKIVNVSNGMVLDSNAGNWVKQQPWVDDPLRRWRIVPLGEGHYAIFSVASERALDGYSRQGGSRIALSSWLDTARFKWRIVPPN